MNEMILREMGDIEKAAAAFSKSGYFTDALDQSKAIVKILAGKEMGFGPFASMTGIHIIQGKPVIGSNLMAAAVKSSGKYDYTVLECSDVSAEIQFTSGGVNIGTSKFTMADAKRAGVSGKDNWMKYPANMLFARAISNGVRWYCPDVFMSAVYVPGEIEDTPQPRAVIIDAPQPVSAPAPAPAPEPAPELDIQDVNIPRMSRESAEGCVNRKGERYGNIPADKLSFMYRALKKKAGSNDNSQDELESLLYKIDAIEALAYYRQNKATADEYRDDILASVGDDQN